MNVFGKLNEKGYKTVPESYYSNINYWKQWYEGNVRKFHEYRVFNGQKKVLCHRYSIGMGKKIPEDWADLLMSEKVAVTLEGDKEQTFFDEICKRNSFETKRTELVEQGFALGTSAIVPRIKNATINDTGVVIGNGADIALDYVTAPYIFPLSWSNGYIIECAFGSHFVDGKSEYLYLQIHHLTPSGTYDIENVIYSDNRGELQEVTLADVKGFGNIPEVVHTNSKERQFTILRPNIANNIESTSPLGISIFANAVDQLKGVDIAYDSYVNEFVLGKKRIMVKPEATKDFDGVPLFDVDDLAFYLLPEDSSNGDIIKEIDMKLRTQEHNAGMQDMLNILSSKCGFGENHYKYDNGNISTATQVISENSSMFRTKKKHEIAVREMLEEFVHIILRLGNTYMGAGLNEDVEISVDFDDSIIEDKETEFNRDSRMVQMGVLNPYEFRMKWLNEDEATAKAALPQMESLTAGEGD